MTASPETRPCPRCRRPELAGYPHRHDEPLRSTHDPMPDRPERLYCGTIDRNAYWTEPDWHPDCCLVHVVSAEYRAELPELIHAGEGIPTRLEPIPVEAGRLDGPMIDVPDRGALGGWPWASPAHRRFGAVTMLDGAQTLNARDYRIFPWAYVIERRLEGHCRRRHAGNPERWPEHDGQAICASILRRIVALGIPPEQIAIADGIDPRRLRVVLDEALLWVWRRVSEELNEIALGRRRRTEIAQPEG